MSCNFFSKLLLLEDSEVLLPLPEVFLKFSGILLEASEVSLGRSGFSPEI
ncbi:MAG: hypothetical protein J7604_02730 [Sporocytophaga sp.]|nr:hypothetical protein [Sporocytophaga sp.]MBO9699094.1 hypothetical protein [Sporocytophaga sp.]